MSLDEIRAGEKNKLQRQKKHLADVEQRFADLYGGGSKGASTSDAQPPIIVPTSKPSATNMPLVVFVDIPNNADAATNEASANTTQQAGQDASQVQPLEYTQVQATSPLDAQTLHNAPITVSNQTPLLFQVQAAQSAAFAQAHAQARQRLQVPEPPQSPNPRLDSVPTIVKRHIVPAPSADMPNETVAPLLLDTETEVLPKRTVSKGKIPKKKIPDTRYSKRKWAKYRVAIIAVRDVLIAVALLFIVVQFISPTVVNEHSMENTFKARDILFVANKAYWFGEPEYGDIVIFKATNEEGEKMLVKRIIGKPGDTISITNNSVYRNGTKLEEYYTKDGETEGFMDAVTVPEDCYFVLGDNRAVSRDSRSEDVGFVAKDQLQGKVVFRAFPLSEIGFY